MECMRYNRRMFTRLNCMLVWLVAQFGCAAEPVSYNNDVLPILAEHCFSCHGFDKAARQADLRLDRRDDALRVLTASETKASLLVERIRSHNEDERMPPRETSKPLSDQQIDVLRQWIEQGAAYDPHWAWIPPRVSTLRSVNNSHTIIDGTIQETLKAQRPELNGLSPRVDQATLLRRATLDLTGLPPTAEEVQQFLNDERLDAFERLVDRLLASPAFGERWSRWWLDLAHYADSDGYLQDFLRPHAWRYRDWVVDALNTDKPFDQFTIEQLAGDLLADQRSLTVAAQTYVDREKLRQLRIATGFLRNTLSNREGGADLEEYRVRQVVDRATTVATTWLGLTIGCAECHDHKYDPITQVDFYRFYALFNNADEVNIDAVETPGSEQALIEEFYRWRTEKLSPVRSDLDQLLIAWEEKLLWTELHPGADHRWDRHLEVLGLIWGQGEGEGQLEGLNIIKTAREHRTRDEQARLEEYFFQRGSSIHGDRFKTLKLESIGNEIDKRRAALPKIPRAQTIASSRRIRPTHVHTRGDFRRPAQLVTANVPAVFRVGDLEVSDRLALARWLVSKDQPLTARVTVNRLWQELFGRGLVSTAENLGIRGNRPKHPELLNWLARRFVDQGWSIKEILRTIMLSETYQQSSNLTPAHQLHDPQNTFWARQSRLRLSAEGVRDFALASSGLMDRALGGPSTRPPQPDSVAMEGFDNKWTPDTGANRYRRGLYTFIQRTSPFAQSITFDLPDSSRSCTRRERSNTPLQALTLLNDPVLFEAAIQSAIHALKEPVALGDSPDQVRLSKVALRILGRPLTDAERATLLKHLHEQRKSFQSNPDAAGELLKSSNAFQSTEMDLIELAGWTMTSSVLLNLDEAITRN